MKTLKTWLLLVTFAFSVCSVFATPCLDCMPAVNTPSISCGGDGSLSKMTLTVKKVVNNESKAEALKSQLMAMNGVKDVSVCTKSGNVSISYDKSQLGCCSKIHSTMKENKWKYSMVSNQEVPACNKNEKKGCSHSHKQGA